VVEPTVDVWRLISVRVVRMTRRALAYGTGGPRGGQAGFGPVGVG